jgi:hypothetical protein
MKAGYHDLSMPEYLRDPAPQPSLSTSTIRDLVERSPLAAKFNHPRLGKVQVDTTPGQDLGSAVHALSLGGHEIVYCDTLNPRGDVADDWKTKDAQKFRDEARAKDQIPLLQKDRERVETAASVVRLALTKNFSGLQTEQTMIWQDRDVWHRGRADALGVHAEHGPSDIDVKLCENADAVTWLRTNLMSGGYDVQLGNRGLGHVVLGQPRTMFFLLVEYNEPYDWQLVGVGEDVLTMATRKIRHAQKIWAKCLKEDQWPGLAQKGIVWATAPSYGLWELESRGVPE